METTINIAPNSPITRLRVFQINEDGTQTEVTDQLPFQTQGDGKGFAIIVDFIDP